MDEAKIFSEGCLQFDQGDYFEAHELWEDLWHSAIGKRHPYLQGLIQVAVAMHHAGNGNLRGAKKLLASSYHYLEKAGEGPYEVDIEKLRDHMVDFEMALEKHAAGDPIPFPFFKLPMR